MAEFYCQLFIANDLPCSLHSLPQMCTCICIKDKNSEIQKCICTHTQREKQKERDHYKCDIDHDATHSPASVYD